MLENNITDTISNKTFDTNNPIQIYSKVRYSNCIFTGKSIIKSVSNVVFENCDFKNQIINDDYTTINDTSSIKFKNIIFKNTSGRIQNVVLISCKYIDVKNIIISACKFYNAHFTGNIIYKLKLRLCHLYDTVLFDCPLDECHFESIKLLNVRKPVFNKELTNSYINIDVYPHTGDINSNQYIETIKHAFTNMVVRKSFFKVALLVGDTYNVHDSVIPINFEGSTFDNINFDGKSVFEPYKYNFSNCKFINISCADLRNYEDPAVLKYSDFTNAEFINCKIVRFQFKSCTFNNTKFTNVKFIGSWFENSTFTNIDYKNITLAKCIFTSDINSYPEEFIANSYIEGRITIGTYPDSHITTLKDRYSISTVTGYQDNFIPNIPVVEKPIKSGMAQPSKLEPIKEVDAHAEVAPRPTTPVPPTPQHSKEVKTIDTILQEYMGLFKNCVINLENDDVIDKINQTIKNYGTNTNDYNIAKICEYLNENIEYGMLAQNLHPLQIVNDNYTTFFKGHATYLYIIYIVIHYLCFKGEDNMAKEQFTICMDIKKPKNILNPAYNNMLNYLLHLIKKKLMDKINNMNFLNSMFQMYDNLEDIFNYLIMNTKQDTSTPYYHTSVLAFDVDTINLINTEFTKQKKRNFYLQLNYKDTKTLNDTNVADKSYIISTVDKPASLTKTEKDNCVYWLNIITGTPDNLDDFRNITNIVVDNIYETLPTTVNDIPEDMDFTSDLYKNAWFIALVNPT